MAAIDSRPISALDNTIAPPAIRRFWVAVKIAMLLGLFTVAAVGAIAAPRIECRGYILTDPDGRYMLTGTDGKYLLMSPDRQCRVAIASKVETKGVTRPGSRCRAGPLCI